MRYAKLINDHPAYAPNPITVDGICYGNPTAELLLEQGYKPVRYTDAPTPEPGYIAVPGWTETAEEIVQTWAVEPEPVTEDKALTRFSNKLTGAEDKTLEQAAETLIMKTMEE